MIEIKHKEDCCGCSACAQICPRQCISMVADDEGFEYPHVDASKCIDCSLCCKVCPVINAGDSKHPIKIYASKNVDEEVRSKSSSGGVFTPLAENIIDESGIVFGVSFDKDWNPKHSYTESRDGLIAFRGSKYVQSKIGTSYTEVKAFLRSGRKVLFSGTSCQVAGLKRFLGKEYDNLFTVEVLCHGVPSVKVWQKYLDIRKREFCCQEINDVSFRDKKHGWANYDVTIAFGNGSTYTTSHKKDPYFRGFMKNLYLRPSCYACKCKNGRSGSDIVIADYWRINKVLPEFNDNNGVSLILANTEKGLSMLKTASAKVNFVETGYTKHLRKNGGFAEKMKQHGNRQRFFTSITEEVPPGVEIFLPKTKLLERIKALIKKL